MTKPITEEQVEELEKNYFSLIKWCFNHQECLNNYGCGWYERFWDTEFKPMFTKILSQARKQAFKEVEAIGKRYKNAKYSTDQFVISGKKWDKLKKLMEVEK